MTGRENSESWRLFLLLLLLLLLLLVNCFSFKDLETAFNFFFNCQQLLKTKYEKKMHIIVQSSHRHLFFRQLRQLHVDAFMRGYLCFSLGAQHSMINIKVNANDMAMNNVIISPINICFPCLPGVCLVCLVCLVCCLVNSIFCIISLRCGNFEQTTAPFPECLGEWG